MPLNQLYYDSFSFKDAIQQALNSNHLDGIKYIYRNKQQNYFNFYDQYSSAEAIEIAKNLNDVQGAKYIFNKTGESYFSYFYKKSNSTTDFFKTLTYAIAELKDLEGVKYLYSGMQHDYKDAVYYLGNIININEKAVEHLSTKLYIAAVQLEDIEGVKYITNKITSSFPIQGKAFLAATLITNSHLIQSAYYNNNFPIAYELIKNGAKFEINYITNSPNSLAIERIELENHLHELYTNNYLTQELYIQVLALTEVMYGNPVSQLSIQKLWCNVYAALTSAVYTTKSSIPKIQNVFETYMTSSKESILDIIKFTALVNIEKNPICMLFQGENRSKQDFIIITI